MGTIGVVAIFLAGCAGVGALLADRWQFAALCSWGAVLFAVMEISFRIGKEPIAGAQPIAQVLLTGLSALGLALLGGYIGYRLQRRR